MLFAIIRSIMQSPISPVVTQNVPAVPLDGDIRITENNYTRVTESGETRITDGRS